MTMMRRALCRGTRLTLLWSVAARPAAAFVPPQVAVPRPRSSSHTGTLLRLSSSSSSAPPEIKHIGKAEMQQIIDDYENGNTHNLLVVDVRSPGEIATTGQLSPSTKTVPLDAILQLQLFARDEDEFEEICGFAKPSLDQTLVFSCAAGVRSVYACQAAASAGYSSLVNYMGGSNEWFN